MGISFSNIGTVGREQLITSGSNGEPNWSYIPVSYTHLTLPTKLEV